MKIKYKFSITIVKKRLLGGLVVFNRANVNNCLIIIIIIIIIIIMEFGSVGF